MILKTSFYWTFNMLQWLPQEGENMIYYTGDIHGRPQGLQEYFEKHKPSADDILVILGDVGANFYGNKTDKKVKRVLDSLGLTVFCIHGNHEMRPASIPTYQQKEWNGGLVWFEPEFPNLLFAKDGEIFTMEGIRHLVVGGAYSVDKFYRIARGVGWWEDEQPSPEIKAYVEQQVASNTFDIILSHTCPAKFKPVEAFLPGIDQSTVDDSTEEWLDKIEEMATYKLWLCGHWHIDKRVGKMCFYYHTFVESEEIKGELRVCK